MALMEVTDQNFEAEVIKSDLPVLVDFWAPWCGPCRLISPIVEELAKEYEGKLKVAKVNVDNHKEAAMRYNVRGIPNLILFKNGEFQEQIVGAVLVIGLHQRVAVDSAAIFGVRDKAEIGNLARVGTLGPTQPYPDYPLYLHLKFLQSFPILLPVSALYPACLIRPV